MNVSSLAEAQSDCFNTLEYCCGFRIPTAVQHSWHSRRAVNEGLLTLSILRQDVRLRLLAAWMKSKDGLLEFIAGQLPASSKEFAVCRFEQLYQDAHHYCDAFEAPDARRFGPQQVVQRAAHAGMVCLPGEPSVLVAPGLRSLCRVASSAESDIWHSLTMAVRVGQLIEEGCESQTIASLLQIGALEYAC